MSPTTLNAETDLNQAEAEAEAPEPPAKMPSMDVAAGLAETPNLSLGSTRRIVLTGFMGAGKSTVGRILADRLGWRFLDADAEIERKAGMAVAEIFRTLGEFVFRRMETSAIAHALGEANAVIALGGGAPEVLANRLLLEQTPHTAVVFLDAPLRTLLDRCASQPDATIRPVLKDQAVAEERFRYRAPLYRRCARHLISTGEQTPAQTAEAVLNSLTGNR